MRTWRSSKKTPSSTSKRNNWGADGWISSSVPELFLRFFEQAAGSGWIENPATAKTSKCRRRFLWRASPLFYPFHELTDKIGREHAMAAHGSKLERLAVGHAVRLPEETQ